MPRKTMPKKAQCLFRLLVGAAFASFFFGVRIMLEMNFNYLILWVRVKGQG